MKRLLLVHWNAAETEKRSSRLAAAGYEVTPAVFAGSESRRSFRKDLPAAVVIDLSRQPSHGLAVALALRKLKATRGIPLVFVGGAEEKVARVKGQLPDAVFTEWSRIRSALRQAIAHPPLSPIVPSSIFAPYAGRPLAAKLGIKPNMVVSLAGAPRDFAGTLDPLPCGVRLVDSAVPAGPLTVWFVRSQKELRGGIGRMAARLADGAMWIAWPKKGSRLASDVAQPDVREIGLAAGLVDYKICAIDDTWSGLCFRRKKTVQRSSVTSA